MLLVSLIKIHHHHQNHLQLQAEEKEDEQKKKARNNCTKNTLVVIAVVPLIKNVSVPSSNVTNRQCVLNWFVSMFY
ncbi:MAG: hypothetical protein EBU84_21185 [Actinobacteria bacterium]|nr:hypothetical protein [Actinomycetota bacterium]